MLAFALIDIVAKFSKSRMCIMPTAIISKLDDLVTTVAELTDNSAITFQGITKNYSDRKA